VLGQEGFLDRWVASFNFYEGFFVIEEHDSFVEPLGVDPYEIYQRGPSIASGTGRHGTNTFLACRSSDTARFRKPGARALPFALPSRCRIRPSLKQGSRTAIRLHDELGLLPPAQIDPDSGYRWYAAGQLDNARLVASLRQIGVPLAHIQLILSLEPEAAAAHVGAYW
jgi:MerR HTH family regulatory protein